MIIAAITFTTLATGFTVACCSSLALTALFIALSDLRKSSVTPLAAFD
jgi:hypothetical protein